MLSNKKIGQKLIMIILSMVLIFQTTPMFWVPLVVQAETFDPVMSEEVIKDIKIIKNNERVDLEQPIYFRAFRN